MHFSSWSKVFWQGLFENIWAPYLGAHTNLTERKYGYNDDVSSDSNSNKNNNTITTITYYCYYYCRQPVFL